MSYRSGKRSPAPSGVPRPQRDGSGSLPIAAYAMLSDCSSAALVGLDGSIDWLCLPRFDSPALFSRLLDPDAGHWAIAPGGEYTVARRYLPGSLVLETTFTTQTGSVRLLDALAFAEGQRGHHLGRDAPHELLRHVEGVSGSVGNFPQAFSHIGLITAAHEIDVAAAAAG